MASAASSRAPLVVRAVDPVSAEMVSLRERSPANPFM